MVNIFTEWGNLKEIIVGDFTNFSFPKDEESQDLSFTSFYNDNIFHKMRMNLRYKLNVYATEVNTYAEQIEQEREEDLLSFCEILKKEDIVVKRPSKLEKIQEIKTPNWTNVTSPCGNIRDQFFIIDNDIIETSPLIRSRYFENDLIKHHLLEYFKKGSKWTCSPKPLMLEESFDRSYFSENLPNCDESKFEIMFDGAQCLKFGQDILFNVANINHELGAIWLQRHLGDKFNVIQVKITDNHLDGMMMPIRPGLLLMKGEMIKKRHLLPKELQKWDYIEFEDYDNNEYENDARFTLASSGINCNVLPLSEDKVIVNIVAKNAIKKLESYGITPIPVQLRHSRLYSGGFHCSTLDTIRDEKLEKYL